MGESKGLGVHLVGSVPLENAEAVFRAVAKNCSVKRIPDGETGARTNWINWQIPKLAADPALMLHEPDPNAYPPLPRIGLKPGKTVGDIALRDLGYASAAIESYATFKRLRDAGEIAKGTKFQVCLPTPFAVTELFVAPVDGPKLDSWYDARIRDELSKILAAVPHADLALQWDTAVEFGVLEGVWPTWLPNPMQELPARLVSLGNAVPADVELGFHLCYGDSGHKHFIEPKDTSMLVKVANTIVSGLTRRLDFLHLPVPRSRDDDAYYAPLRDLKIGPETELYLGLVHRTDGAEGAARRIAAAKKAHPSFGVATECGLGRRPAEHVEPLLALHDEIARR